MYKIPTILTADEIMDKAFKKASKVQVVFKQKLKRHKKLALAKVISASNTISSTLNKYIKAFPSFEALPLFYHELFDVGIGIDAMRKSLGAVDWCRKTIKNIADEAAESISRLRSFDTITNQRIAAYGRFSSVLRQVSEDLEFLNKARQILIRAPEIDAKKPTIVIAGAPNVGKSQLLEAISSARPKIATYPFTTKGISVGHFEFDGLIFQVIDTPGLLDREMEKRNEMEKKAILALRHLANVIVFVIDPSEHCGYSTEEQLAILADIASRFADIPLIEVENKVDVMRSHTQRMKISALGGEGVKELKTLVVACVKEEKTPLQMQN